MSSCRGCGGGVAPARGQLATRLPFCGLLRLGSSIRSSGFHPLGDDAIVADATAAAATTASDDDDDDGDDAAFGIDSLLPFSGSAPACTLPSAFGSAFSATDAFASARRAAEKLKSAGKRNVPNT
jgi:hypothetical protein